MLARSFDYALFKSWAASVVARAADIGDDDTLAFAFEVAALCAEFEDAPTPHGFPPVRLRRGFGLL